MTPREAERRLRALRAEIRHHDYLYYVKDAPELADSAYDALFAELQRLEQQHPELQSPDSPTQRVGGAVFDRFPAVEHTTPMLSLDSDRDEPALRRFDERVRKSLGASSVAYVLEPKLDGASVELVYEDGILIRASTRGDGRQGEGITDNVRTIETVPLRLAGPGTPPPVVALRGEVIMHLGEFERLNQRLLDEGREPFANPRNAAAGALRQLDPLVTASRPLDIYVYDILAATDFTVATQWEALEAIRAWGFPVTDGIERTESADEVVAYHRRLLALRDDLDYEIDGVVVKLDDLAARERLGSTSHHPRWAFAFKFPPRRELTRILKIVPSVGRTGVVTPVALLRPVELGGVTVSRATLHNREEVARKDVREGDSVRVQRAGDVIPQVIERIVEPGRKRGPAFRMPGACPSCGATLVERGPFTVCPNSFECPAQLVGRLVHFGSREALDIEGLGEQTARLLVDQGLVTHLDEIFDLSVDQLVPLEGFARKSATNLVTAIRNAATVPLPRFLFGIGIPEVGATVARALADQFGTLAGLRSASEEDLQAVDGVGSKMAEQITGFLRHPRNGKALDALLAKVTLEEGPSRVHGGALDGLKFVFTGGLSRLSRSEAEGLVQQHGGLSVSSVSRKTDYVVAGTDPGSKLAKAESLGITILDEDGFVALLQERGVKC